ncbi:glycine-rich domain-containing protein [Risungbinella massiliensis]|uniref:hypothetical protein n=1 Tax=Risungbinella massiliensis TaxID=1329796 RepID=UPI0005CC8F15|nr:hypothetical protein [Risungbinella massiliensis]
MEYLVSILLFFFIAVTIMVNVWYRQGIKSVNNQSHLKPYLGIQETGNDKIRNELIQLTRHLEASFPDQYVNKVKERVLREQKIGLTEWDNRWFEWKRYFVLRCLVPNLPMPSREIDVIWHEMLHFPEEYEAFCTNFIGKTIEHPERASSKKTTPHERAWFDLLYITLFQPTQYSPVVWGVFLKNALSQNMVNDWLTLSKEEIIKKYFSLENMNYVPGLWNIGDDMIERIRSKFHMVDQHVQMFDGDLNKFRYNRKLQPYDQDPTLNMLTGVIFLSMVHQERFPEMYYLLYVRSHPQEVNDYTDLTNTQPPKKPPANFS